MPGLVACKGREQLLHRLLARHDAEPQRWPLDAAHLLQGAAYGLSLDSLRVRVCMARACVWHARHRGTWWPCCLS